MQRRRVKLVNTPTKQETEVKTPVIPEKEPVVETPAPTKTPVEEKEVPVRVPVKAESTRSCSTSSS